MLLKQSKTPDSKGNVLSFSVRQGRNVDHVSSGSPPLRRLLYYFLRVSNSENEFRCVLCPRLEPPRAGNSDLGVPGAHGNFRDGAADPSTSPSVRPSVNKDSCRLDRPGTVEEPAAEGRRTDPARPLVGADTTSGGEEFWWDWKESYTDKRSSGKAKAK